MEIKQPDLENMINQEIEGIPSPGGEPIEKEITAKTRLDARTAKTIDRIFKKVPKTTERETEK